MESGERERGRERERESKKRDERAGDVRVTRACEANGHVLSDRGLRRVYSVHTRQCSAAPATSDACHAMPRTHALTSDERSQHPPQTMRLLSLGESTSWSEMK